MQHDNTLLCTFTAVHNMTTSHLYEVNTPLIGSCSKATHVANDTTPEGNKCTVAIQSALQRFVPNLLQDFQILVLLSIRQCDDLNLVFASCFKCVYTSASVEKLSAICLVCVYSWPTQDMPFKINRRHDLICYY